MRAKFFPWQYAGMTPTRRTKAYLKHNGWEAEVTERWNPHARIRQDLFRFIDILAVHKKDGRLLALQTCSGGDAAARVKKIKANPIARLLALSMAIEVWSWAKRGKRLQPKLWTLRKQSLTAELLPKRSLLRKKLEEGEW
jgi:hypothetical protein